MPNWQDQFTDPTSIEDLVAEPQQAPGKDSIQHPVLEALAQPLLRLSDAARGSSNAGTVAQQGGKLLDLLGVSALGNTLHRFAMGDSHVYSGEERDQANLDFMGALPIGAEAGSLAKGGLRAALEGSVRADGKTALGMFTGQHAATSDLGALEQARLMAAGGKDPEEIHSITGWFKGKDGQWRQEINDSTSAWKLREKHRELRGKDLEDFHTYKNAQELRAQAAALGRPVSEIISRYEREMGEQIPDKEKQLALDSKIDLQALGEAARARVNTPMDVKLSDILQHQRLYEAYPHLKDVNIHVNDLGPYVHGSMNPETLDMKLNSRSAFGPEGHKTVLHEIQHAIQEHEGFDPGASEGDILERNHGDIRGHAQYEDTIQASIDIRNGNDLFRHVNPDAAELADDKTVSVEQLQDYLHTLQRNRPTRITPAKAREMYNAAGGEVEARATEKRRKMSQAERRGKFPMSDYDVPQDQILLRHQR